MVGGGCMLEPGRGRLGVSTLSVLVMGRWDVAQWDELLRGIDGSGRGQVWVQIPGNVKALIARECMCVHVRESREGGREARMGRSFTELVRVRAQPLGLLAFVYARVPGTLPGSLAHTKANRPQWPCRP